MKIAHIDRNHPLLLQGLKNLGFENHELYHLSKAQVAIKIKDFEGLVIRSRFALDASFLKKAVNLKFIARVGAGMENIDVAYAQRQGVKLLNAPEGNRNAVGEHALGLLLALNNKLLKAHKEVTRGIWLREENRGWEIKGKTAGLIGYGNTGKNFAQKLHAMGVRVLCYDILKNIGDKNATQVPLIQLQQQADIISLHVPQTVQTLNMINTEFINACSKPFWLINTARGKCVNTADLAKALKNKKVLGAGLDVLEYEKTSFEKLNATEVPEALTYLLKSEKVIISPHVAGWTFESKEKLAQVILNKIQHQYR